ncbi:MAG: hypothetical protein J7L38_03090 [Thermoproteales archaeon]|nr:hypothetical protein [Thermoproteales archaeon]
MANIEDPDTRKRLLEVARVSYELYLNAYTRNNLGRGIRLPAFITSLEELSKYIGLLKSILETGKYELMLLPKG